MCYRTFESFVNKSLRAEGQLLFAKKNNKSFAYVQFKRNLKEPSNPLKQFFL